MTPGFAALALAGGFITYEIVKTKQATSDATQQNKAPKQPFWNEWLNGGDQPATGNGSPGTDQTGHDVANVVVGLTKFATSLAQYFGTAQDNQSSGSGTSTGGPTNTYAGGRLPVDEDGY